MKSALKPPTQTTRTLPPLPESRTSFAQPLTGDWTQVQIVDLSSDDSGLGFGIVGGRSTGVVVKTVLAGAPAAQDGRVRPGDHLLQINGINLHGMSSQQVAMILRQQDPTKGVRLTVGRPVPAPHEVINSHADRGAVTVATKTVIDPVAFVEYIQQHILSSPDGSVHNLPEETESNELVLQVPVTETTVDQTEAEREQAVTTKDNEVSPPDVVESEEVMRRESETKAPSVAEADRKRLSTPTTTNTEEDTEATSRDEVSELATDDGSNAALAKATTSGTNTSASPSPAHPQSPEFPAQPDENETGRPGAKRKHVKDTTRRSLGARSASGDDDVPFVIQDDNAPPLIFEDVALTTFCRANWISSQVDVFDTELERDSKLGLGITVAGYVHRREEISGVFVKNLVPNSAADHNGLIKIHDLILEVNTQSLEGLSHAESVRLLVNSGKNVRLKFVRFLPGSPQAACLAMLREQESETQMIDIHKNKEAAAAAAMKSAEASTTEQRTASTSSRSSDPQPNKQNEGTDADEQPAHDEPLTYARTVEQTVAANTSDNQTVLAKSTPESVIDTNANPASTKSLDENSELHGVKPQTSGGILKTSHPASQTSEGVRSNQKRESKSRSPSRRPEPMSDEEIKAYWKAIVGDDHDIVIGAMQKPADGGLGLSLEGTVDVLNGVEIRPHHYVQRIHPDGPAGKCCKFRPGDELLEINGIRLHSASHVEVRRCMASLPGNSAVRLAISRPTQVPVPASVFMPSGDGSGMTTDGNRYSHMVSMLNKGDKRMIKAKSEQLLPLPSDEHSNANREWARYMHSRSLEQLHGMAVWSMTPTVITLHKGTRGMGFTVLDYQDSINDGETVIVIKSLVPGGPADKDGRIVPGDRLLYVNDVNLTNATLDQAVNTLKTAPQGPVILGIAKPLPADDMDTKFSLSHSPLISRSERLLAKSSFNSPQAKRKRTERNSGSYAGVDWSAEARRRLYPQAYHSYVPHDSISLRSDQPISLYGSYLSMVSWSPGSTPSVSPAASPALLRGYSGDVLKMPSSMENTIKIRKGRGHLVSLEPYDKGINGCVVSTLLPTGIIGRDNRIKLGDFVTKINNESLRNVTGSQARAILKRASLIGSEITITYISVEDAEKFKHKNCRDVSPDPSLCSINRLSPKNSHLRSPYLGRRDMNQTQSDAYSMRTDDNLSQSINIDDLTSFTGSVSLAQATTSVSQPESSREQSELPDETRTFNRPVESQYDEDQPCAEDVAIHFADELTETIIHDAVIDVTFSVAFQDNWSSAHRAIDFPTDTPASEDGKELLGAAAMSPSDSVSSGHESPCYEAIAQHDIGSDAAQPMPMPPDTSPPRDSSLTRAISETGTHESSPIYADADDLQDVRFVYAKIDRPDQAPPPVPSRNSNITITEPVPTEANVSETEHVPDSSSADNVSLPPEPIVKNRALAKVSEEEVSGKQNASRTSSMASGSSQTMTPTKCKFWGEPRTVELSREPTQSFGISIVGGRVEVSQKGGVPGTGNTVSGIFIKSVMPESPAGYSQLLHMGDRIISVNETDLRNATHEYAVEVIRQAENPVKFVVQSIHSFSPQQIINPNDDQSALSAASSDTSSSQRTKESTPPTVISIQTGTDNDSVKSQESTKKSSTEQHAPINIPARVRTPSLVKANSEPPDLDSYEEPDKSSDVDDTAASSSDDELGYSKKKLESRYGHLRGQLLVVAFDRAPTESLGISLAGHRDRSKLGVFVVNISATSPAAKAAPEPLCIGDELMEINGQLLHGNSHIHATTVIRQLRDTTLRLVLMRRPSVSEEVATTGASTIPVPIPTNLQPQRTISLDSETTSVDTIVAVQKPDENDEQMSQTSSTTAHDPTPVPAPAVEPPMPTARTVYIDKTEKGFGITLTDGQDLHEKRAVFVTEISADSSVAKLGDLKVGDQVLAINSQSISNLTAAQVAELMQTSSVADSRLQLTVTENTKKQTVIPNEKRTSITATTVDSKPPAKETPSTQTVAVPTMAQRKTTVPGKAEDPATVEIEPGTETLIEIDKGGHGLGLSIVGGCDTVLGTVVIHEVYTDGAAARDARLKPGDQLLEVNSQSLRQVTHEHAIKLLRHTPAHVRLIVFRDLNMQLNLLDPTQIYNVIEVDLQKKPGKGLGLSIVGRKSEPGVYLSEIVKGGVAEADARLMPGDQILAVNKTDVTNSMQEDVATLLKTALGQIHLKVGRWKLTEGATTPLRSPSEPPAPPVKEADSTTSNNSKPPSVSTAESGSNSARGSIHSESVPPVKPSSRHSSVPKVTVTVDSPSSSNPPEVITPKISVAVKPVADDDKKDEKQKSPTPSSTHSSDQRVSPCSPGPNDPPIPAGDSQIKLIDTLNEDGSDSMLVVLRKAAAQALGMGIGKRARGILVTSIQDGGVAGGILKVGDRVMAVNGQVVDDQISAVEYVKNSGPELVLQIARPRIPDTSVTADKEPEESYGFSIVGGASDRNSNLPIAIKRTFDYGAARNQLLKQGDQIVAVNEHSLVGLSHRQAVSVLQKAHGDIELSLVPIEADVQY